MSDEPVEDGDSGSDAEGASSTSGSRNDAPDSGASADPEPEEPKGATEPDEESKEEGTEEPAEIEETSTWDGDSWVPPDDEAEAEESEGAEPQPDDGDATGGEDASEEDDGADSPDSDSPDPDAAAESEGEGAAEPPTDRRGSGRARMGSRPPPGDHSEQRSGDEPDADAAAAPDADAAAVPAADADADSASDGAAQSEEDQEERVSHHDPDDFGSTPGQPEYATDKLDDEDAAPEAGDGDAEHPNAPGTPDDRPRRNPKERSPRGSAHSRGGAKGRSQPDAATSSSTAVTDDGGSGGSGGSSILSGGIGGSAPPDDEEMPLTEHIEEMLTRLAIVVVVAAFATLAAFPYANDVIIHMWYDVHTGTVEACKTAPQSGDCVAPHVYGPLELVLTRIRVAGLAGLLAALPLGVYQTYRFMRPGLYPHERRYYLAAVPFSLVLAILGMLFAYFVLLPLLFAYFIGYTQGSADLAFQLAETMNLILLMMGMLAIIFQIPLLIMLAIMMGITTRRWLERRRLYFWGLFLGVAVIFGPDPTGMAPFLLMATMVALFEGTLLLLRWTGR